MRAATDDNDLHAELAARLGEFGHDAFPDPFRVDGVLKESSAETTQLVGLRLADGRELGPFVRKIMSPGTGAAWRLLMETQRDGLRSANLPRVLSCDERGGRLQVLMECVPGPTLRELVAETPSADRPALAARMVPQLCDAVTALHEGLGVPVIHRDITPSNVICSGTCHETAVLIDLGIAREWKSGAEADTTHFGTRAYAAPEQYGFGQTDVRSDVYALGLLAFFCLVGRDPTPADRERDFSVEGVSEGWRKVIARAVAFDPDDRFASARELRDAIDRVDFAGDDPTKDTSSRRGLREHVLRLWRGRNVVVLPVMALLVAVCTSCALDPKAYASGSVALNVFGYLVYMNYLVLAVGYLLMDKRWLRLHVRLLRERTFAQDLRLLLAAFAALTMVLLVLSGLVGT